MCPHCSRNYVLQNPNRALAEGTCFQYFFNIWSMLKDLNRLPRYSGLMLRHVKFRYIHCSKFEPSWVETFSKSNVTTPKGILISNRDSTLSFFLTKINKVVLVPHRKLNLKRFTAGAFVVHPQNSILVLFKGCFQNFWRAPRTFMWECTPPPRGEGGKGGGEMCLLKMTLIFMRMSLLWKHNMIGFTNLFWWREKRLLRNGLLA